MMTRSTIISSIPATGGSDRREINALNSFSSTARQTFTSRSEIIEVGDTDSEAGENSDSGQEDAATLEHNRTPLSI